MRILTLSNSPLDDGQGSGYVVLRYVEGLRLEGHQVELIGPKELELFPRSRRGIRYRQALGMAAVATTKAAKRSFDVLELYGGEGWLAALLLRSLPHRSFLMVAHSNGVEPHCAEHLAAAQLSGSLDASQRGFSLDLSAAYAAGFRAVDGLVTVSEFDQEYAKRHGYAGGQVVAIENPLPEEYLAQAEPVARQRTIGFVGSWLPRKGIAIISRDLPMVLREFSAWRLVLVGVGARFRAADHFPADVLSQIDVIPTAERLGLLRTLYSSFSIAIVPSLYESFGLTAAEAMACGAALVATPVGLGYSLRAGAEALVLEHPFSPGLARALRKLIVDDGLRARIASAGRARVQGLRWQPAVGRLARTYETWLATKRQRPPARKGRQR
jgi:glycosyltransferase involved in cell wall biosynthesis